MNVSDEAIYRMACRVLTAGAIGVLAAVAFGWAPPKLVLLAVELALACAVAGWGWWQPGRRQAGLDL